MDKQTQDAQNAIRVSREVHEAGEKLAALEGLRGMAAHHFAEVLRDGFRSYQMDMYKGNVAFWSDVYVYLMSLEAAEQGTAVIVEDE